MFFLIKREVFDSYFFNDSFCSLLLSPFLGLSNLYWYDLWCLTDFLGCVHFLHSFFLIFLRLGNLNSPIFKFADLFFCLLKILLSPSSEFFISIIVLFNSRVIIWFFFFFSYFLYITYIFYLVRHHFLTCF